VTINTDGDLKFKPGNTGVTTYTITNLSLVGNGLIDQGTANTTVSLVGTLQIAGTPTLKCGGDQVRTMYINSLISGTGKLNIAMVPTGTYGLKTIRFNNNGNTFSGVMEQTSGTLQLNGATVLGQTRNLTVLGSGTVQPLVDLSASATTLTLTRGKLILKRNVNFANCIIGGKKLATGSYKASDLQTSFTGVISNDGGSLIVGVAPTPTPTPTPTPGVSKVSNSWLFN
jgi:hypothetical protein